MLRVGGILQTALYVDDLSRSAGFSRRLFGFGTLLENKRIVALNVADAMAGSLTVDDLAAIERIAWRVREDHRAAAARAIDRHLGLPEFTAHVDRESGESITWVKAVGQLVIGDDKGEPLAWATPDAVGDLTLSQWRMVRSGGEIEQEGDPMPEDKSLPKPVERARWLFFHGTPMPEEPEPEPVDPDPDAHLLAEPPQPEGCVAGVEGEWEAAI